MVFYVVTKLSVTKLSVTKLSRYQIVGYQIVSYQFVSYQIVSYQKSARRYCIIVLFWEDHIRICLQQSEQFLAEFNQHRKFFTLCLVADSSLCISHVRI